LSCFSYKRKSGEQKQRGISIHEEHKARFVLALESSMLGPNKKRRLMAGDKVDLLIYRKKLKVVRRIYQPFPAASVILPILPPAMNRRLCGARRSKYQYTARR
jgi:hypothetical protein